MNSHKSLAKLLQKFLILLIFSGVFSPAFGQGWSYTYWTAPFGATDRRCDIINIPDFVDGTTFPNSIVGSTNTQQYFFSRIIGGNQVGYSSRLHSDDDAALISNFPQSSLLLTGDSMIVMINKLDGVTGRQSIYQNFYGRAADGTRLERISSYPIYSDEFVSATGAAIKQTTDGNFISLGTIRNDTSAGHPQDLLLIKSNLDGEVIWSQTYPSSSNDLGVSLQQSADGGFWLLKNTSVHPDTPRTNIWLLRTDANGNLLWERQLSIEATAFDMTQTLDGGLALTGHRANNELFVQKADAEGNLLWQQNYPAPDRDMSGRGIIEDEQQNLVVSGRVNYHDEGFNRSLIAKLNNNGVPLWERTIKRQTPKYGFNDIVITPSGEYLMGGYAHLTTDPDSDVVGALLVKTDTFGIVKSGLIQGEIFYDFDEDCSLSDEEIPLEGWNVQAISDEFRFYGRTDASGNYALPVDIPRGDSIDYIVSISPPSPYWQSCVNDLPVKLVYLDTARVDFPVKALVECPFVQTQISNDLFRPCSSSNVFINYCNNGTLTAEQATITITLDDALTFVSADIPATPAGDQTYTFELGDLAINECGSINVSVNVACDGVELGDVLCIEAQITPNTLCMVPGLTWSGALLELNSRCNNDSIFYQLENVGTADMGAELGYVIIEDAVLRQQGSFNLSTSQTIPLIGLPLDGSVYHFFAQQEPGAPGAEWISLTTVDCQNNNDPAFHQFPQYGGNPFMLSHCPVLVGPFDPNDKQAIPAGFGETNNILPNTTIDYTIRFQNTGTDTAFRVIILDTLPLELDPISIVPGPSSHPYDFKYIDEGVLSFSFHNIELPDSNVNLAASQGFVSFKIDQRDNLPNGTRIENSASIYFDFNPPIITEAAFHTVQSFIEIVSGSVQVVAPELSVNVMPNPMKNGALIRLEGQPDQPPLTLQLLDINSRVVREVTGTSNTVWLDRGNLTAGMYFFTLSRKGLLQASGKLVVE